MADSSDDFDRGYLIATANIMNLHGDDTIAENVLSELGVSQHRAEKLGLTDYDLKPLRRLFREIRRKQAARKEWAISPAEDHSNV